MSVLAHQSIPSNPMSFLSLVYILTFWHCFLLSCKWLKILLSLLQVLNLLIRTYDWLYWLPASSCFPTHTFLVYRFCFSFCLLPFHMFFFSLSSKFFILTFSPFQQALSNCSWLLKHIVIVPWPLLQTHRLLLPPPSGGHKLLGQRCPWPLSSPGKSY